jgi:hypothetical protein
MAAPRPEGIDRMATAQKRGFRFPWESDGDRDEPDRTERTDRTDRSARGAAAPNDEPTLAQRLGVAPDDLGRGPFDLAEDSHDAGADVESPAGRPADAGSMAGEPQAEADQVAARSAAEDGEPQPQPQPQTPTTKADAGHEGGDREPSTGWPEADWRSERPVAPRGAASSAATRARRDNPLVAGLVKAMRDAARTTRDEAVTSLRTLASEQSQAIRAQSTETIGNLRKAGETDVAAIRDWSKAEMARIREETDARINERRARLVTETDGEARAGERRLAALGEAIERYEAEAAAFFEALLAEEDPARLAGLAERMPAPPSLGDFASIEATDLPSNARPRAPRTANRTTAMAAGTAPIASGTSASGSTKKGSAGDGPAEASAEPPPSLEDAEAVDAEAVVAEGVDAEARAPEGGTEAPRVVEPPADDALDQDAAAAAEAESLAGLESQTQLIVSGLTSVASIATFKAALVHFGGVNAVSVNAGSDGDCLFTVTHARDADLRDALRDFELFQTRVIADDGDTLVVVAHEPAPDPA